MLTKIKMNENVKIDFIESKLCYNTVLIHFLSDFSRFTVSVQLRNQNFCIRLTCFNENGVSVFLNNIKLIFSLYFAFALYCN